MKLTAENHGDFSTVREFWDCECEHDYIHRKTQESCPLCNTYAEDQPDSRLDEVMKLVELGELRDVEV